jgi:zinc protease
MKKILLYITICCLLASPAFAQIDRSKAPEPGPPPEIQLGEYESFTLKNGLKVFVVRNTKLPRVAFNLLIDRDPILEGDKAGYVSATGSLLRRGTTNRSKDQLDEEIDFIGASLSTSSNGVYASALSKHKEKLVALMADVVLNPAFPEEELDKIITQTKSGLAASKEDPETIAANVQSVLLYGKDHPYGEIVTEESVDNISIEDAKRYYNTYFKPNIAYLAIVGDINKKEAQKLVRKYFGGWKEGEVPAHEYEDPQPRQEPVVAIVDRPTAVQSIVNIMHPIELTPGHPDVITGRVMNEILGGGDARLFRNLREDKGYTYGAYSSLASDELVGKFMASASVRNVVTDSAVAEFMYELHNMRDEPVSQEELDAAKNYITGSFARSLESPQTIAAFALNIERYGLDKDYYKNYLKKIAAVDQQQVKTVAQKYIQPGQSYIMVVGNADEVKEGLARYGTVEMYDIYGNKLEAMESGDITAESIIEKYVEAVGGKERLEDVSGLSTVVNLNFNGMEITNTTVKKGGDKYMNSTKMGEQEMNRVVYNEGEAKMFANGQSQALPPQQATAIRYEAFPFPELHYQDLGFEMELKGTAKVDGKDAYQVVVKSPEGERTVSYYDVETGFKVKTEAPSANVEFSDYQETDGIMFPGSMKLITPQGTLEGKTVSVEVNPEVSDQVFSLQ